MTVLDAQATLSGSVGDVVTTGAAPNHTLVSEQLDCDAWQHIIDDYLVEWGRDPRQLEDEDIVPPSVAVITLASQIAMKLRDEGCPPPLRVVPDGEGGITFERRTAEVFESLTVNADGSIELTTFMNCQLLRSERFLPG